MDQTAFDLTMDSINAVRTCIDDAIRAGRTDTAWALAGKHALMVRSAAAMRAPVVTEALRAEALVARALQLTTPEEIERTIQTERAQRDAEALIEKGVRDRASAQANATAAAEKAKLEEARHAKLLADEELQAQMLTAEIAARVAKELAAAK